MLKQTLFFSTPVRLSLKNSQLVISWRDSDDIVTRPIEDIGFVIIENQQVSVSIPLLNELVRNNCSVIFCDERHLPSCSVIGYDVNATQAESVKMQVSVSEPRKKRAWQQIIEMKIRNQAALLNKLDKKGNTLKRCYSNVLSGDSSNQEGQAARIYWKQLLGKDFIREPHGFPPNNFLDYGYTLLRAAMARAIVGSGLSPIFGLFHRNRYDAYALADDLMEPYRPYVDEIVMTLLEQTELTKENKVQLLKVLTSDVSIGEVTRPLQIALTMTTASLVKYYKVETNKISLPKFK